MPELPEVETYRRNLEKALKNKTITNVDVHPDNIVFSGMATAKIKKAFLKVKVLKCKRKGKYLWFEMSKKPWPVFHLGMTGSYEITDELPKQKLKSIKLILEMNDGTMMIFRDPRRFGRMFLLEDPLNSRPLSNLGPDVLKELPTVAAIKKILQKKNSPVKAVLLDQSVFSGIGNWMADEILYQSGIDPHRKASGLKPIEIKKLHDKILSVTKFSVKVGADDEKYPETWLFHHRWGRRAGHVYSGHMIKHSEVGGRSTAWVPEKQK